MRGIIINCANKECRKMLMKNTYLRPGSFLTVRCFHCGVIVDVHADQGTIKMKIGGEIQQNKPVEKSSLTDEDDEDMIFLSV